MNVAYTQLAHMYGVHELFQVPATPDGQVAVVPAVQAVLLHPQPVP